MSHFFRFVSLLRPCIIIKFCKIKPFTATGKKNLIGANLIALRKKYHLSQRGLAHELQLAGYDMDKNVITRIETQQRYVTDIEIKALCDLFNVSFEDLIK